MSNKFYTAADANGDLAKCHIELSEITCHTDDGGVCPDCHGEAKILVETAWAFKTLREALGEPIHISSGYRCPEHQKRLWVAAIKQYGNEFKARQHVAPPYGSPHNYGVALDLLRPAKFPTSEAFAEWINQQLGGDVRIGVYDWGVHIDRAHYLNPNPNPADFRKGVRW